ncbi:class I SAM-dependent methyltransferase [Paenibacillus sacheonensis]|uniref:Methyltransferase domain-containing protein n=1 Tax=Paenibacillus sacheonensis TaxID=742054 RepID=A0A7X4YSI7_9BACL|nr:class I SAM-dependent methyltransferase [Paenibacillus sacheonensis]MBM7569262.1 ubiquinone/menaquinone biosynthesis C-methylase UbiE [Paenibacillus sacheonensis]NBC71728.1 methyltransferase domain-containing protein [Paenibacillus sacheonensis]
MEQNLYDNPVFFNMYKNLRETKITYNDFIEQPAIRRLLPNLANLNVLDLGCGFGELTTYMADNGAMHVTGVDISEKMLAMTRKHQRIDYIHSSMEEVQFNPNAFDLVVSSLAFHYIEDYNSLMSRISKWIQPNGYLIFSTEHPVVLADQKQEGWIKDANNNKIHWPIANYGEEGRRTQFWGIDGVIKYHRKLSTLMNVLIRNGFMIQEIDEPESIPEGLEQMPKLISERMRPSFIVIKAQKLK